jgi:hypothetical protein
MGTSESGAIVVGLRPLLAFFFVGLLRVAALLLVIGLVRGGLRLLPARLCLLRRLGSWQR